MLRRAVLDALLEDRSGYREQGDGIDGFGLRGGHDTRGCVWCGWDHGEIAVRQNTLIASMLIIQKNVL